MRTGTQRGHIRELNGTTPKAIVTSVGSTDGMWRQAVDLANVATIPHGERAEALAALLERADREARCTMLTNLVLSGEVVNAEIVRAGVADLIEAAQTDAWLLTDSWRLNGWLRLIPFTSRPSIAPEILQALPEALRRPSRIEPMLRASTFALDDDTADILFELAKLEPLAYGRRAWREAVAACKTASGRAGACGPSNWRGVWRPSWRGSARLGSLLG